MFNYLGDFNPNINLIQSTKTRKRKSICYKIGWFLLSLFDDERMLLRFIGFLTLTIIILICTLVILIFLK